MQKEEVAKKMRTTDDEVLEMIRTHGQGRVSAAGNPTRGSGQYHKPSLPVKGKHGTDWVNIRQSTLNRLVKKGHLKMPKRSVSGIEWQVK